MKKLIILSFSLVLIGCKAEQTSQLSPEVQLKQELYKTRESKHKKSKVGAMRVKMLQDTAISYAARAGLAYRANELNRITSRYSSLLDRVFNFNSMLLDKNVLPPVLATAHYNLDISHGTAIRVADRTYKIVKQAKFVTCAPSWRDYFWLNYKKPNPPNSSLTPKNNAEQEVWKRYIDEGWQEGIKQANLIYKNGIAKLVRDYKGMVLYKNLLSQNMVTAPFVATTELGVTGGGNNMTLNEKIMRITALPQLQANSSKWKTEITLHE